MPHKDKTHCIQTVSGQFLVSVPDVSCSLALAANISVPANPFGFTSLTGWSVRDPAFGGYNTWQFNLTAGTFTAPLDGKYSIKFTSTLLAPDAAFFETGRVTATFLIGSLLVGGKLYSFAGKQANDTRDKRCNQFCPRRFPACRPGAQIDCEQFGRQRRHHFELWGAADTVIGFSVDCRAVQDANAHRWRVERQRRRGVQGRSGNPAAATTNPIQESTNSQNRRQNTEVQFKAK